MRPSGPPSPGQAPMRPLPRAGGGDRARALRIALCDYSGHPFQVELSRELARRGHSVLHLHFAAFLTPKGSLVRRPDDPPDLAIEGIDVGRTFDKGHLFQRRRVETKVGRRIAARALDFAPDLVIGCNMPLDGQKYLIAACRRSRTPFLFWVQDLYAKAIRHYVAAKLGPLGHLVGMHYARLEGRMLRASDAIVTISEGFGPALAEWGVPEERITVIPNWAPLSEIGPRSKDNPWARRHGLGDRTVALYTGTIGLKHDPALLLALARKGAASGFTVAVVSQGPGADFLTRAKETEGLDSLVVLPFQAMEDYPEVLGAGDVLVAMLDETAASFSVPSKILSYLAAGKPIVAAIAAENDAAILIRGADAGLLLRPGDAEGFCDAVASLAADPARRGRLGANARRLAETRFAIAGIADRFELVFERIGRDPTAKRAGYAPPRPASLAAGMAMRQEGSAGDI